MSKRSWLTGACGVAGRSLIAVALLAPARALAAQQNAPPAASSVAAGAGTGGDAGDTVFLRARQLIRNGNAAAGRALVDSMVAAGAGTRALGTALYWRAALAPTAADAERDYRRVIVEYPFVPHAGDALLALAQLELARNDRAAAATHLQRFLAERPNDPERVRVDITLGTLLLEQNDLPRGCAALLRARASLGNDAVEQRNRIEYAASRCAGVDTAVAIAPAAARSMTASMPVSTPTSSSTSRPSAAPTTGVPANVGATSAPAAPSRTPRRATEAPAGGRYTIQIAAYDTRAAADRAAARLTARGLAARVVATAKPPYRVRIGHYATEAAARAAARSLASSRITGFVATTDIERGAPARPR